jgi:predicted TIM-barrel fold metal-dependent hydrolase
MIIDARVRPPYKSFNKVLALPKDAPPRVLPHPLRAGYTEIPSVSKNSMDLFWEEWKEAGIDKAILVGRKCAQRQIENEDVAELRDLHPDKFVGAMAGIDAAFTDIVGTLKEVDRLIKDMKFNGIVMDPGWCVPARYVDDRRLYPIYARCAELGCVLYLTMSLMQNPGDISYASPERVHRVATDFPKLQILVVHHAFPFSNEMIGIMVNNAGLGNIWVHKRMVFGTAFPVRPLKMAIDQFRALGFNDDVMEDIMFKNAAELFKLEL